MDDLHNLYRKLTPAQRAKLARLARQEIVRQNAYSFRLVLLTLAGLLLVITLAMGGWR